MAHDDQLLGRLEATADDHERRLGALEKDVGAIKRFTTSFVAILTAAIATAGIWWKGIVAIFSGK